MSIAEPPGAPPFSEKGFYLEEFRGRTLAIAVLASELRAPAVLGEVVEELARNRTRVVLLSTERASLEPLVGGRVIAASLPRLEGAVWRQLREGFRVGVIVGGTTGFGRACREIAVRLGIPKLVWIDRDGAVLSAGGGRLSFVHLDELRQILAAAPPRSERRGTTLREVEALLSAGVPAVNVCSLEGLHDELFSYAGSGTLFTQERYVTVRRLSIDDFDAASDLLARGTAEGYLAPRSEEQVDAILASGFGAFIEGRHLAGIGALLVDGTSACAEVASLYTLTRFVGEGVGGHLVAHARSCARERGLAYVFACTTSERVAQFFERQGFRRVSPEALPRSKWRGYDADRRARVTCVRSDLT